MLVFPQLKNYSSLKARWRLQPDSFYLPTRECISGEQVSIPLGPYLVTNARCKLQTFDATWPAISVSDGGCHGKDGVVISPISLSIAKTPARFIENNIRFWKVERIQTGWGPLDLKNNAGLLGFSFCFICPRLGSEEAGNPETTTSTDQKKKPKKSLLFLAKGLGKKSSLARQKTLRQEPPYSGQRPWKNTVLLSTTNKGQVGSLHIHPHRL